MDAKSHHIRILMFPWLAHGHILPFLELAKKLSKRHFSIYVCSTPIILSSINHIVSNFSSSFPQSIQLVELNLPSLPNLPPHFHTTKSLPPHLIPSLTTALDMAQPSFSNILKTLDPDLLIYDFMQPWAPQLATSHNIPAIQFLTMGALASSYFYHRCKKIFVKDHVPALDIRFPYLEQHEDQRITKLLESPSNNFENKNRYVYSLDQSQTFILIRTFGDIERKYIENLSFLLDKEIVPVGPLVDHAQELLAIIDHDKQCSENLMEWLGKKQKGSTVFASFGSEYYLTREEIEEIALGLELSKVNFIWVIRFHDDDEIVNKLDEVLPQGFLERIKEKGIVVEGWASQVEILGHCSIGGFLSHCGWSSVIEAMRFGVPIIAMPMQIDQPLNARLVVNELGVGLEAKRDNGKIRREEVAKVIREVVEEKEGEEVRKRMEELREKMRKGEEAIDVVAEKLSHLFESKVMRNSS